jgi:hypothetical protein
MSTCSTHAVTLKVIESHNGRQVDRGITVLRDRPKGRDQDQGDHFDLDLSSFLGDFFRNFAERDKDIRESEESKCQLSR